MFWGVIGIIGILVFVIVLVTTVMVFEEDIEWIEEDEDGRR